MRKKFEETTVILISTLKWSIFATVVGVAVGASTAIFLKSLAWGIALTSQHSYYYLLLPVAFFVSAIIIQYLAPDAEGHGTEKVIEAVHKHSGKINAMVIPVKLVTSVITLAFGGSAGKEGPCAQIGGGVSSVLSDVFRLADIDRKKLVICGISAGFASVFGTPVAGAIFGVEVLFVGAILYDVLLPSFIAGIISFHVSSSLGVTHFHHSVKFAPVYSESLLIKVIIAGILFGVVSLLLIETMKLFKALSDNIQLWKPLKGIIGGLLLIGLTLVFSTQFLGLGLETIQAAMTGTEIIWYAFILKIIFTAITLNFGGSGGVITPIFFIGATAGAVFANLLGLDNSTLAAIGLVSLLAGTTNTPIASSIMSIELFGADIAPYAALACVISFLVTGHRSIYPSQILGIKKSASIQVELGGEISKANPRPKRRKKSFIDVVLTIAGIVKARFFK